MEQESRSTSFWKINFASIRVWVSTVMLLIAFILALFLVYISNRLSFYTQVYREIAQEIELTDRLSFELFRNMEASNEIIQNQLINQTDDINSTRRTLWEAQTFPILDSLEMLRKNWLSTELKLNLATIRMNLKKLKKDQDEIELLLSQEVEKQYFVDIGDVEVEESNLLNSQNIYNRNVSSLMGQLHKLFIDFQKLKQFEYEQKRSNIQSRIQIFWIYVSIFAILALAIIIFAAREIFRRFKNRFDQFKNYLEGLIKGDIPRKIFLPQDESREAAENLQVLRDNLFLLPEIARNVREGKLNQKIEVFEAKGEIGQAIQQMQEDLSSVAKRDFQRNWVNEGIALFGGILREYDDAQTLYDRLVSNLVKYLKANQGGIFILNDDDELQPYLSLRSVYAFDRKRVIERRIDPGQGLIGQAWKEKDVIYLEETAEGYIQISSGLGGAQPRSLLIVPMVNNESKVLGALELASFKHFENYEVDFVKRVAEMIVSAISSIKNNEKNRILLAEAQRATDQMRKKEEEMRMNMLELMDTQDQMTQNQSELEGQKDAINATLATVDLDLDGKILSTNEIFANTIGREPQELKGIEYEKLLLEEELNSAWYQYLWDTLKGGSSSQNEIRLKHKNHSEVWFNATFTPIKNAEGKPYKVISMALNITEQRNMNFNYQSQIQAIKDHQALMIFDRHGFILEVNDLYLELLEYQAEDLIGKHHSLIIPPQDRESNAFINFWDKLSHGIAVRGKFRRLQKNQEIHRIWASYTPIENQEGKVERVLAVILSEQEEAFSSLNPTIPLENK